jgi:tetratricopeptide (TPR) repeat protein
MMWVGSIGGICSEIYRRGDVASKIPLGLRAALESGDCVLFIGAGIGKHLFDQDGKELPDGKALAIELDGHFKLSSDSTILSKVARLVEIRKSRPDLIGFLSKRLASVTPDETLQWIAKQRWSAIFTTNYDDGIERCFDLVANARQSPVPISVTTEVRRIEGQIEVPVYHLHGKLRGEGGGPIVITSEDYTRFAEKRKMLFEILKQYFATSTFLYIGYSNQDPNWQMLYEELRREFSPQPLPRSFRVDPYTTEIDAEILKSEGLETIKLSLYDFVDAVSDEVDASLADLSKLEKLRATVPAKFMEAYDRNPAPVIRLLNSWVHVNSEAFDAQSNVQDFIKGDFANWAAVAKGDYFYRDLEPLVFDQLLDYATVAASQPQSALVIGSAGFGTSTLLRALAVKYVSEGAGPVFYHRPDTPLTEGDLEFACSLFENAAPLFVVDNAADFVDEIRKSVHFLRDNKRQAFLLYGDRTNEWAQTRASRPAKVFQVEALSDGEIDRLLEFLGRHGALNKLEGLSKEMQVAAVRQRHGKDLLVVMREATENKSFDAIIEDEYIAIQDALARKIYLAVCCVNQHGGMIRDQVLSSVAGVALVELYDHTLGTEGVVIFESIDDSLGMYAARARHRVIATVVWERCGENSQKNLIAQSVLDGLNLNVSADVKAFEHLVRNDDLVDGLRSLDDKIRFFDSACRKDPLSPYVRQHYARMFLRAEKPELALQQVEAGIEMPGDTPRVLFHTKGQALSQLAVQTASIELARKRLAQAESAYRTSISMSKKDAYAYQGLAQLFLDWAKRAPSADEESLYLSKCEDVIGQGLREVRDREGLWIVSAAVAQHLENDPKRLAALERAVRDSPEGIVSRYLLARVYRAIGRPEDAKRILEPVVSKHLEEFRSFCEYALALHDLQEPLLNAINVLRQSWIHGSKDARYLAILGGMLYLNEQYGDAETVFSEGFKRGIPSDDLQVVRFRPIDRGAPVRVRGTIAQLHPGYCLIDVPGRPRVLCPASKYRGVVLVQKMSVEFDLVFSAKGSLADRLQISS